MGEKSHSTLGLCLWNTSVTQIPVLTSPIMTSRGGPLQRHFILLICVIGYFCVLSITRSCKTLKEKGKLKTVPDVPKIILQKNSPRLARANLADIVYHINQHI